MFILLQYTLTKKANFQPHIFKSNFSYAKVRGWGLSKSLAGKTTTSEPFFKFIEAPNSTFFFAYGIKDLGAFSIEHPANEGTHLMRRPKPIGWLWKRLPRCYVL